MILTLQKNACIAIFRGLKVAAPATFSHLVFLHEPEDLGRWSH